MKLGILGGTFDPPHVGHVIAADEVRSALDLDLIYFIPAARSPHKRDRKLASASERLTLVGLATLFDRDFLVSDIEIRRRGVSYTVDTLEALRSLHARDELFFLIGMDNVLSFHTWKSPHRILELATVVAMTRPGYHRAEQKKIPRWMKRRTIVCPVPEIGVSSSDIRRRIREAKPFRHMVPELVYDYITLRGLYVCAKSPRPGSVDRSSSSA
ncbi:MAG: nicotinic acid mononucleotide adenylyltransferase [Ignavibacteria bacterium]